MDISLGAGLRNPHIPAWIETRPSVDWLEIHAENFFFDGPHKRGLHTLRCDYGISIHGVGLSLGSHNGLDKRHLAHLKALIDEFEPMFFSEHVSWNRNAHVALPDLLPMPYTKESLQCMVDNVEAAQDYLGRTLLLENPSSYLHYPFNEYDEWEFIVSLCQKSGAKLLLDVNNIYVSSQNHDFCPIAYLEAIPKGLVEEIHLAGHELSHLSDGKVFVIDTHNGPVQPSVWPLYQHAVARFGGLPTLLEWDADLPSLSDLITATHLIGKHAQQESI